MRYTGREFGLGISGRNGVYKEQEGAKFNVCLMEQTFGSTEKNQKARAYL